MTGLNFSIIVPTYNRPQQLARCLRALAELNYEPEQYEIIVVDDGGNEPPETAAPAEQGGPAVTYLCQAHSGPAMARNRGAEIALGRYLVFTDDDCAPLPDWLSALEARFAYEPESLLGGSTINGLPDSPYSTASQLLIEYLYAYFYTPGTAPRQAAFVMSNNMAMPAELFKRLGGFQPAFPLAAGEDRELCHRWQRHGYRMSYAPEARVRHQHHLTFAGFWRQHFNYGRGAYQYHRLRAAGDRNSMRGRKPIQVEPFSFYRNLLLFPLRARAPGRWRLTALLALSQFANASGFAWENARQLRIRRRPR